MHTLRWAIIGPGNIAEDFITDLACVQSTINLVVGVMSDKKAEAASFAGRYGIAHCYDSLPEMLRETNPRVAYIATPHPAHFSAAMSCIKHGCAVLCEKPLAMNAVQAGKLIDAARRQKVFLLDLGIYPVYLSLLVLGIPAEIEVSARLNDNKIDESCSMVFRYGKERFARLESSLKTDTSRTAKIAGDKGKITILKPWNEKPEAIKLSMANKEDRYFSCKWPGRGFQYEIEEVIHCLEAGKFESSLHSHANSMALIHTLDKIRQKAGIVYPEDEN